MSLNMMAIEMPVAKASDFYQHVQVKSYSQVLRQPSSCLLFACRVTSHIAPGSTIGIAIFENSTILCSNFFSRPAILMRFMPSTKLACMCHV